MYIMLSGRPPFGGKNNHDILNNVLHSDFNFDHAAWTKISDSAKDLIKKLLVRDVSKRLTSEQAYQHPWIQQQIDKEAQAIDISGEVIKNMNEYADSVNFKRTTLTFIASRIPEDQIKQLKDAFSQFDKNGDGRLTLAELKEGVGKIDGIDL